MKENIISLAKAMGWIEITGHNNSYMVSFVGDEGKKDVRINVYFTKMTVTIQWMGDIEVKKNMTLTDLEDLFSEF